MKYKINTITRTIPADLQTPVGIYMKIRDLYPQSALLESSDYHTAQNSFSIIGVEPIAKFSVSDEKVRYNYPDNEEIIEELKDKDLIEEWTKYLACFSMEGENVKYNGFFGYTGYDAVRYFENVNINCENKMNKELPDMMYILYRFTIIMNHFHNQITIVENLYGEEISKIEKLLGVLSNNNIAIYDFKVKSNIHSSITDNDFIGMVKKGISHTYRGDVFQIVLSRCFNVEFNGDDFNVYRALRCINPSPYLFYFDFGDFRIMGSSPETHLRVENGKAYIDPIAGTFKRTGNDEEDRKLAELLLKDEKENAEHIMLVDLARNDLSRSAGNVHIEFLREIQFYSHVIHMVSRVSAELSDRTKVLRLFADTFPAGTLSGAPKVRAMQLINDIESHNRGIYGGCIGFVGFNGDLNQAITIRSFLSYRNKLYFQAGAGIVAHSQPENELQEINNKLGALFKAVEYAENIQR